jgi:hypothetical protein
MTAPVGLLSIANKRPLEPDDLPPQRNGARVMNTTTNNREHNNRELTDAELLDVCGGTDNVLEAVGVRLEAAAKAASSAVSTIVKAF